MIALIPFYCDGLKLLSFNNNFNFSFISDNSSKLLCCSSLSTNLIPRLNSSDNDFKFSEFSDCCFVLATTVSICAWTSSRYLIKIIIY